MLEPEFKTTVLFRKQESKKSIHLVENTYAISGEAILSEFIIWEHRCVPWALKRQCAHLVWATAPT